MPTVRSCLVAARNSKGLSHEALAELVGITRQFYGMVERGVRTPSLDVALRIAEVLDADPRELFADVLDERAAVETA